jgi:hypothetical protein
MVCFHESPVAQTMTDLGLPVVFAWQGAVGDACHDVCDDGGFADAFAPGD